MHLLYHEAQKEANGLNSFFPHVSVILDTKAQQCTRPIGSFHDAEQYYSYKHHKHGIKTLTLTRNGGRGNSGFQGLQHNCRAVLPIKKRQNGEFSAQKVERNWRISVAKVFVEIFYGRMSRKFRITRSTHLFSEKFYCFRTDYNFFEPKYNFWKHTRKPFFRGLFYTVNARYCHHSGRIFNTPHHKTRFECAQWKICECQFKLMRIDTNWRE